MDDLLMKDLSACLGNGFVVTHPHNTIYRVHRRHPVHRLEGFVDLYVNRYDAESDTIRGATGPNSDIPAALVFGASHSHPKDMMGENSIPKKPWHQLGLQTAVVRTPVDAEGTLVWRYGSDWRVPKADFKGRDST